MSEKQSNVINTELPEDLGQFENLDMMTYKSGARHVYGVDNEGKKRHLSQDDVLGAYGYGTRKEEQVLLDSVDTLPDIGVADGSELDVAGSGDMTTDGSLDTYGTGDTDGTPTGDSEPTSADTDLSATPEAASPRRSIKERVALRLINAYHAGVEFFINPERGRRRGIAVGVGLVGVAGAAYFAYKSGMPTGDNKVEAMNSGVFDNFEYSADEAIARRLQQANPENWESFVDGLTTIKEANPEASESEITELTEKTLKLATKKQEYIDTHSDGSPADNRIKSYVFDGLFKKYVEAGR